MAIIPRLGTFQAPPPVVPQGLATRAPSAMARATGTKNTPMETNQPRVPAGLASLASDMTQEIDDVNSAEELNSKVLQAGREINRLYSAGPNMQEDLSGQEGDDVLVGQANEDTLAPTASVDPSLPVIPGEITNEEARQIAKDTIGITGGESEEDAYTALMMFGLGLMATPGPLGEAIGKAGLNVMPQITKARQAQRARRKDVGVMAYNIREKNKAQRVAARSAQLKQFNEDRNLALDLYKQQNAQFTKRLDIYLKDALPGVPAKVMKHARNPDFAKLFGKIRRLGRTPEGMSQIMTNNGETLAQLAISSAIRSGDIKEGDLGKYQDPGWNKFVARHPDKAGYTRNRAWSSKRAYAKHPKTGDVGWIEPGTVIDLDDDWAPPTPHAPVVLWGYDAKTKTFSQTTEDGLKIKALKAFMEREANVFSIIDLADQSSRLADDGALFATSEPFSFGPKVASYLDAAVATVRPEDTELRNKIRATTNKFTGALGRYLGKDLAANKSKEYSDRGLVLNGQDISGKSGVASWLKKIESEDVRNGIGKESSTSEKPWTEAHRNAFNNLASMQPRVRAMMFNMAYAVARAAEPGGRLTDRDIVNAMLQLGGDKSGNIASPQIFKDVLQQTVRQVAQRHQTYARQLPDETGFQEYTVQDRWNKVQRTLTGAPKELPAWLLEDRATAAAQDQTAAARDQTAAAGQPQVAQTDRLKTSIVNAPINIGDQTTSLSQSYPFFAQDMVDSSGRLRTEKETLAAMGIPWGTPDAGKKGLEEMDIRIAAQEGLPVTHADIRPKTIQTVRALQNFYKNPNAAAQLRSYLQPPYAPSQ
jgi:hypothetical protein